MMDTIAAIIVIFGGTALALWYSLSAHEHVLKFERQQAERDKQEIRAHLAKAYAALKESRRKKRSPYARKSRQRKLIMTGKV